MTKNANLKSITDEELFSLVRDVSDELAFAQLYERHWKRLFLIAYSKIGCKETSEGVVQDLFTNIWKRRKNTNIQQSFVGYINTALRYIIINHYKHIKVRQDYSQKEGLKIRINSYNTEKLVSYNELFTSIQREVDKLPNRCSQIFKMSRFEDMTNKEIAEKLEISSKTVENQITKAIKLLRLNLKELISLLITFCLS